MSESEASVDLDRLAGMLHAWGVTVTGVAGLEAALGVLLLVDAVFDPNWAWKSAPATLYLSLGASIVARLVGSFIGVGVTKSAALLGRRKGAVRAVFFTMLAATQPVLLLLLDYLVAVTDMGLMCSGLLWVPLVPVGFVMAAWTALAVAVGREQFDDLADDDA